LTARGLSLLRSPSALGAVAQQVVGQRQRDHRLGDQDGMDQKH
jgi:hypothetical protein